MKRLNFDIAEGMAESTPALSHQIAWYADLRMLAHSILKVRALQAFDHSAARFPIYRDLRLSVRMPLEDLLDRLALGSGLAAQRLDEVRTDVENIVDEHRIREDMFTIDWRFQGTTSGLECVELDEVADPDLLDEAYPMLNEPVAAFIERYLDAPETVLILQGPPGTGKTRLVRAILAALTQRKGEETRVLYTADRRALENDEIFVEFVTDDHEAFVIEDADHVLQARSDGNLDRHRFLAVADGIVRALGRKMIFTTNLPRLM